MNKIWEKNYLKKIFDNKTMELFINFDFKDNDIEHVFDKYKSKFENIFINDINNILENKYKESLIRNISKDDVMDFPFMKKIIIFIVEKRKYLVNRKIYEKILLNFIRYNRWNGFSNIETDYEMLLYSKSNKIDVIKDSQTWLRTHMFLDKKIKIDSSLLKIDYLSNNQIDEFINKCKNGKLLFQILIKHIELNLIKDPKISKNDFKQKLIRISLSKINFNFLNEMKIWKNLLNDYIIDCFYVLFWLIYEKEGYWFLYKLYEDKVIENKLNYFDDSNCYAIDDFKFETYIAELYDLITLPKIFWYEKWQFKIKKHGVLTVENKNIENKIINKIKNFFELIWKLFENSNPFLWLLDENKYWYIELFHIFNSKNEQIKEIIEKLKKARDFDDDHRTEMLKKKEKEKIIDKILNLLNNNIKGYFENILQKNNMKEIKSIKEEIKNLYNDGKILENEFEIMEKIINERNNFAHKKNDIFKQELLSLDINELEKKLENFNKYVNFLNTFNWEKIIKNE